MANSNGTKTRFWDWFTRVMATLTVAVLTWALSLEVRMAAVEGARFTDRDGVRLERELKEWVDGRHPAAWLKEDIREIKDSLKEIKKRLRTLEQRK